MARTTEKRFGNSAVTSAEPKRSLDERGGPLMTRREVADMLAITEGLVDKMDRRGDLPSFPIGDKLRRWHRDKVLAYIEKQQNAGR
jgi:predicted DNA-binding transcriptional regulator AlpA